MVILSTSPGKGGAARVLKTAEASAGYFGAEVAGSLSVGSFADTFNSKQGILSDPTLAATLLSSIITFKRCNYAIADLL